MSETLPLWADHEVLKGHCEKIQYFGLGFVQVKISPTDRFHYYHPDLMASVDPESIHNHRYNFRSNVMKGTLLQELFDVVPGSDYRLTGESCMPDTHGSSAAERVGALLTASFQVPAGEGYGLHYSQMHRVEAVGRTVTWLVRSLPMQQPLAQVLNPIDAIAICPFKTDLSSDELWDIVVDTIN